MESFTFEQSQGNLCDLGLLREGEGRRCTHRPAAAGLMQEQSWALSVLLLVCFQTQEAIFLLGLAMLNTNTPPKTPMMRHPQNHCTTGSCQHPPPLVSLMAHLEIRGATLGIKHRKPWLENEGVL